MTPNAAIVFALAAAACWGLAPLLEKLGLRGSTVPMAGLFYRCVGVILGMIVLVLFMVKPQEIRAVGPKSALYLVAGGFLASFIAQAFFYQGLKMGEMSRIVPISATYPLIAFGLGVLVLGESLSMVKLAGALLIVLGVWCLKIG
jgi:bacterial/archaeal transporter family protein